MQKEKNLQNMTVEELKKELEFVKECLRDEEELFNFTFNKSAVHIGALDSLSIQKEHEEKCNEYKERIKLILKLLKT